MLLGLNAVISLHCHAHACGEPLQWHENVSTDKAPRAARGPGSGHDSCHWPAVPCSSTYMPPAPTPTAVNTTAQRELQENTDKQFNETGSTLQEQNEKFDKEIET